nr:tetratricopeptide repeat protein [Chitinispirillaceae bacterium]
LLKKKSFDQAITSLEMVLTVSPNDIGTMLLLVQGYMETKRQPQALELLKKAKTLDRNSVEVRSRLYDLFRQNGQASEAEAEIKDLIEKPGDNKYRLLYARDLIAAKRYDDAYGQVAEIKSRDPMNVEGLMLRGSILRAQKKYDQAIETYKEISFINEEYAPALCERGDTYRLMGQYDRALQYLTKAQKADPKNSMAELGLALLAKTQNKTAEYKEHLAKARALDPKNPAVIQETGK